MVFSLRLSSNKLNFENGKPLTDTNQDIDPTKENDKTERQTKPYISD